MNGLYALLPPLPDTQGQVIQRPSDWVNYPPEKPHYAIMYNKVTLKGQCAGGSQDHFQATSLELFLRKIIDAAEDCVIR
jgi:hypothetical protein